MSLSSASQAFTLLLLLGAGTGSIYILRWFWWRISAVSEIVAMIISLVVSIFFTYVFPHITKTLYINIPSHWILVIGVGVTTFGWILFTFFTPHDTMEKLYEFCQKVRPGGPGWNYVYKQAKIDEVKLDVEKNWEIPKNILAAFLGCICVYSFLFSVGYWVMNKPVFGGIYMIVSVVSLLIIIKMTEKFKFL